MKKYEFITKSKDGVIEIPEKYQGGINSQNEVKVIVLTKEFSNDPLFDSISISTKDLKFDREEANKR